MSNNNAAPRVKKNKQEAIKKKDDGSSNNKLTFNMTDTNIWSAFLWIDSGLPTGSFAHSSGMEVAQQFGFLKDDNHVEAYIRAATHSGMQLAAPFVVAGSRNAAGASADDDDDFTALWQDLDQQMHALLVSNSPACQASIEQGHGLLRVALAWTKTDKPDIHAKLRKLQELVPENHGHLAPIFGIVTTLVGGIDNAECACHMLAYTMTRDMVSAAVRLNAIGPLASVSILSRVQQSVSTSNIDTSSLESAASSAPLLDVLHPCHELLAVRLFRT